MNKTQLDTNENETTRRERLQVYPTPPDAPEKSDGKPEHSEAVSRQARDVRRGVLQRIFGTFAPASAQARAEVGQLFDRGGSGEYESNSPLLYADKEAHVQQEETIEERLRNLL